MSQRIAVPIEAARHNADAFVIAALSFWQHRFVLRSGKRLSKLTCDILD